MVMGLQILYPSQDARKAEAINADIVAVHGLNGDSKNTWTSRQTNAFWLKDFLPLDVPHARVMTFGYNAHAAFGNTTADIIDHAKSLLSSLIDKREEDDELRRPIIFIGHSLGGIVIKQSLFQATIERRYNSISDSTIGIVFLGTPHRGSPKAAYGKVLAALAATVLNNPSSCLAHALQTNSEALIRLNTDFRSQLPKYQIYSFYEMKPMKKFSDLVVGKHSALLEVDGEEQIPVNTNHEEMCKFMERQDDTYEKVFKRVRRMMTEQDGASRKNLSEEICLYGLGGSGNTQACLKFAQDNRERFWGIFWIDASSDITATQGFLEISRTCGIDEDPKVVRQWLSNTQNNWLLVIDNADDPSINVSKFFPTGNRGSIVLTTRNPDCKIHSTVGSCELGQLNMDDAVTLLLKATGAEDTTDEASRKKAIPITKTIGFLALAIVQAGAYIRQGRCRIDEYCELYTRCRQRLLEFVPIQQTFEYKYSVYTTWEISIQAIESMCTDTSRNAIDLLRTFCFFHYDGISEEIFERAWSERYKLGDLHQDITHVFYMQSGETEKEWDKVIIREAAVLLSSFSLIKIDERGRCMSMHPLVHVWARDRLSEELQRCSWVTASSTIAATISSEGRLSDYRFRRYLLPHIKSCISLCRDEPFLSDFPKRNRVTMAEAFAVVFSESGLWQQALELTQKVLKARQRTLGSEHPDTLGSMFKLAAIYSDLGRRQEAMELAKKVEEARQRILGSEHPDTLRSIHILANIYSDLGCMQDGMELGEKVLEARQRTLGSEHPDTLRSMSNLANRYSDLGRWQEALELGKKVLEARRRTLENEHTDTLSSMCNLAIIYSNLGRWQEAMELAEKALEARQRTLGNEHPDTLKSMSILAISYRDPERWQEAIGLAEKVLEARERTLGNKHPDTLFSMNNLAAFYSDRGRKKEAIELAEKVLEASQRILGSEHPDTFSSMNNLALYYSDQGRKKEAIELAEKVLEARQRTLGNEHRDALISMNNLAAFYSDLGHRQKAIGLAEKALEASQRTLGNEDPDTLRSMKILEFIAGKRGDY